MLFPRNYLILTNCNPFVFNIAGLSLGRHTSTMTVHDYFLNELPVTLEVKVEEGVNTRFIVAVENSLMVSPNPFTSEVRLNYSIIQASKVSLSAYDLNGRLIAAMFDKFVNAGSHTYVWKTDVEPGIYLVKLISGDTVSVVKVIKK